MEIQKNKNNIENINLENENLENINTLNYPQKSSLPTITGREAIKCVIQLKKDPIKESKRLQGCYGDFYQIKIWNKKALFTSDAKITKQILVTNSKNYRKSELHKHYYPMLGQGLLTAEGKTWQYLRHTLNKEFKRQHIEGYTDLVNKLILEFCEKIGKNNSRTSFNLYKEIMNLSINIMNLCLFGSGMEEHMDEFRFHLLNYGEYITNRMLSNFRSPRFFPTPSNIQAHFTMKHINRLTKKIIDLSDKQEEYSFVNLLKNAKFGPQEKKLTQKEIRDQVITFLAAGHETTGNALTFIIYLLLKNPTAMDRIQREIEVFKGQRNISYTKFDQLTFTTAVIQESFRLYPPLPIFSRNAIGPDLIQGHTINPGTLIFIFPHLIHRNSCYWDNANDFIPERFLKLGQKDFYNFSFIPFGLGKRKCIGEEMSMMILRIAIPHLLNQFEFKLKENFQFKNKFRITLAPENGLWVYAKRKNS